MNRIGRALRNRRVGERALAWNRPQLQGPETLVLTSPAFEPGGSMPASTAARSIGGDNVSPALAWSGVPADAVRLRLLVQDADVPLPRAITHARAEFDAATPGAAEGAIPRWHGPAPIPGHGPHRYVFQLFAVDAAGRVVARGRLDGLYERV